MEKQFYLQMQELDNLISSEQIDEKLFQKAILTIENEDELLRYFMGSIKDLGWFKYLKIGKYFDSINIPFKDDNYLFWNVLDYLERVSEQVKDHNEYGKELLINILTKGLGKGKQESITIISGGIL